MLLEARGAPAAIIASGGAAGSTLPSSILFGRDKSYDAEELAYKDRTGQLLPQKNWLENTVDWVGTTGKNIGVGTYNHVIRPFYDNVLAPIGKTARDIGVGTYNHVIRPFYDNVLVPVGGWFKSAWETVKSWVSPDATQKGPSNPINVVAQGLKLAAQRQTIEGQDVNLQDTLRSGLRATGFSDAQVEQYLKNEQAFEAISRRVDEEDSLAPSLEEINAQVDTTRKALSEMEVSRIQHDLDLGTLKTGEPIPDGIYKGFVVNAQTEGAKLIGVLTPPAVEPFQEFMAEARQAADNRTLQEGDMKLLQDKSFDFLVDLGPEELEEVALELELEE